MEEDPYAGLSDAVRKACIKRMQKTLTRKPRCKKTREYVKSLSGSAVMPVYRAQEPRQASRAFVPSIRKDRVSPFARNKAAPSKVAKGPRRPTNCRPDHRFRFGIRGDRRQPRDMETVYSQRELLVAAQTGLCGICGEALPKAPHDCSLDHVIPRAMGGVDELGNLVAVHKLCNAEKSNDVPTGCEMVFLLMVNAKIGAGPVVF